ncbi:hypothetical protein B4096_3492 [Heyndrickxia coagulans]|nr:hypothetical protein B4096_3492 [Heyndrickxia coagulans]
MPHPDLSAMEKASTFPLSAQPSASRSFAKKNRRFLPLRFLFLF